MNKKRMVTVGVLAAIVAFLVWAYSLRAEAQVPPDCSPGYCQSDDTDQDSWVNAWDNCTLVVNVDQQDADFDGYGNACDGDFDNSGMVTVRDFLLLRDKIGGDDPVYDLTNDNRVRVEDYTIFRTLLSRPPGPSARAYSTIDPVAYDMIICELEDCLSGVWNPEFSYVSHQVVVGTRGFPVPDTGIPTGIAGATWCVTQPDMEKFVICN